MGSGFARLLAAKGFEVAIGHKNPEKAIALAKEIGAKAKGGSVKEAVNQTDLILLAVAYGDAVEALKAAGDLANKIVIDISNPSHPTSRGLLSGTPHRPQKKSRKSSQARRS
jgi:predicted dinucleotide-binding enzyme